MQLVVDSNILVSFFRQNPVRFLIVNSRLFDMDLFIPEYSIEELKSNKAEILKYSGLNLEQFENSLSDLQKFVNVVLNASFKDYETEAKRISPHDKDIPFFALALKLGCNIWSNEPAFKRQSRIKVFNTKELLELM